MTLSEYVAQYIHLRGVDTVFEMIGGMSVRLIDAIYRLGKTRIISMHHEQGAAFAACGWSQVKRIPGIAIATSGPGATNLITGIATCYFDSIPAVFITGQVNQDELSIDKEVRQLGFQETDIVTMVKPITKFALQLSTAQQITSVLPYAFEVASKGRCGPVLIDIPMNLQREVVNTVALSYMNENPQIDMVEARKFIQLLNVALLNAKRPLFLVGGGVLQSKTESKVRQMIEKTHIPAVFSLHGKCALDSNSQFTIGMIGSYGNRWANIALSNSDVLIVLGSRMDIRQTGADKDSFIRDKEIYQIDVDINEIDNRIITAASLCADLTEALPLVCNEIDEVHCSEWLATIDQQRQKYPDTEELIEILGINPNTFLKKLSIAAQGIIWGYVTDVGANQIWSAQSVLLDAKQRFITSGSMGAMGYALPTAIGASEALDNTKDIIVIAGDGGIQCNIQELELLKRLNLKVKVIILNNRSLGMVKQFQREYFDDRFPGTELTYGAPDFVKISDAYGIESMRLSMVEDVDNALAWLLAKDTPCLLEVTIDPDTGIFPKMQFGHSLDDMMPKKD